MTHGTCCRGEIKFEISCWLRGIFFLFFTIFAFYSHFIFLIFSRLTFYEIRSLDGAKRGLNMLMGRTKRKSTVSKNHTSHAAYSVPIFLSQVYSVTSLTCNEWNFMFFIYLSAAAFYWAAFRLVSQKTFSKQLNFHIANHDGVCSKQKLLSSPSRRFY